MDDKSISRANIFTMCAYGLLYVGDKYDLYMNNPCKRNNSEERKDYKFSFFVISEKKGVENSADIYWKYNLIIYQFTW